MAEVSNPTYQKLMRLKADAGYKNEEWSEWLHSLTKQIPLEPTLSEQIHRGTQSLLSLWMKNFGDNLPLIRKGDTFRELLIDSVSPSPHHRAVVLGRGPSIFRNNHLELLHKSDFEGLIIATDGILSDCLNAGIFPDYVVCVDGSPVIKKWFDYPITRKEAKQIKAVIATQVDHEVVLHIKDLGYPIYWFQAGHDDIKSRDSKTRVLTLMTCSEKNPDGVVSMECGGNVGATSWVFAWSVLKRYDVALIGFDYGYPDDMPLEETYYYDKTVASLGVLNAKTFYERIYHPYFKTWSKIDPAFKSYQEGFFDMLFARPFGQRTVNCTEGGCLFHPQLDCMYFKDWLEEKL